MSIWDLSWTFKASKLKTPEDISGTRKTYYNNQGRVSNTLWKAGCKNMNHVFYKADLNMSLR